MPTSRQLRFLFLLLVMTSVAHALDPNRFVSQYGHSAWRLHDGELPAPVYPMVQTNDGYLWLGTQAGLVRFDGIRFVSFSDPGGRQLPGKFITSLLRARDGSLWIGSTNQLLDNPDPKQPLNGKVYGYDPMLFYFDVYIPWIAQGMDVRVGRWLSLPDIEAQFSPNNYLLTHSILYTVDPYTQMGVMTTTKLSDQWTFQIGVNGSNDVAVWNDSAHASLQTCARWVSADNNDMLYPCINNYNHADYDYNNVQMFVMTWGHRFSPNFHMLTEAYHMFGRNIPGFGPVDASGAATPGSAGEFGIVNYLNFELNPTNMLSFRNEWYNDERGQRTGFATKYTSHTLGLTHWMSQDIELRPEIRYEHSYGLAAYDGGRKNSQTTALFDVILHF